jgi:DNA-binding CsgD family transcriptional regulator
MTIDHLVARLTEREKESLRGRLNHMTAKEIALDLGVSHHAVEKRLKMARTKLGARSSLEAARMLAEVDGYQGAVAAPPDHAERPSLRHSPLRRMFLPGGFVMIVVFFAALGLVGLPEDKMNAGNAASETVVVRPKPGDLEIVFTPDFDQLDQNGSGYLEGDEVPQLVRAVGSPTLERNGEESATVSGDSFVIAPTADRDAFYRAADTDGDGKVSRAEFGIWSKEPK